MFRTYNIKTINSSELNKGSEFCIIFTVNTYSSQKATGSHYRLLEEFALNLYNVNKESEVVMKCELNKTSLNAFFHVSLC